MSGYQDDVFSSGVEAVVSEWDKGHSHRIRENCYVIKLDNRPIFFKISNQNKLKHFAKKIEFGLILKHLYRRVPTLKFRDLSARKKTKKEIETIIAWRRAGIPAPEVLAVTTRGTAFSYVEGVAYRKLLSESYRPDALDKLLTTFHQIRRLAQTERNIDLLHSDCHLANFLYDETNDVAVAIDPSIWFYCDTSFADADASLNLFLAFSFLTLKSDLTTKLQYLRQFLGSLSAAERGAMFDLNDDVPKWIMLFFSVRNVLMRMVGLKETGNILARYSPENVQLINELLADGSRTRF